MMKGLGLRLLGLLEKPPKFESFNHLHKRLSIKYQIPHFLKNQQININQLETRKTRMDIPRLSHHKATNALFLQQLYPLEGDSIHHETLYNAYCSLPSPQPMYIQPQHFEQFLCEFVNSGGVKRRKVSSFLENVIIDMSQCKIRASLKEINNYLYLKYYNAKLSTKDLDSLKKDYKTVKSFGDYDISTMNIFLKFGLCAKDFDFVSMIMNDIREYELNFDRMTYQMLINHYCLVGNEVRSSELFNDCLKSGIVPDICFFNSILKSLVRNNELEIAMKLIDILFKHSYSQKIRNSNSNIESQSRTESHQRRINLQELRYIDSLKLQEEDSLLFIPTPNLESFLPILHHFTIYRHFDPLYIYKYLEQLNDLGIKVPGTTYIQIFNGFQKQDKIYDSDHLKFILNFLMNEPNLKYNRALFDSLIEAFLKHSRYNDQLVNGIEKQWLSLKHRFDNESSFKTPGVEIEEFTNESISKLMAYY